MKLLLTAAMGLAIAGCATPYGASSGMASYAVQSEGCSAKVMSGRNVSEVAIEGCGVKAQMKGVTGMEGQLKLLELLESLL